MEQKICGICKETLPVSEFHVKNKAKGLYRDRCKRCARDYHRQHYLANKQVYVDRATQQKRERLALIRAAKDKPCADCGVKYPYWVMQFDHVTDDKVDAVRRVYQVEDEIAKCEVVCANCHADRTYKRQAGLV